MKSQVSNLLEMHVEKKSLCSNLFQEILYICSFLIESSGTHLSCNICGIFILLLLVFCILFKECCHYDMCVYGRSAKDSTSPSLFGNITNLILRVTFHLNKN
jgi:hypothetical protein